MRENGFEANKLETEIMVGNLKKEKQKGKSGKFKKKVQLNKRAGNIEITYLFI